MKAISTPFPIQTGVTIEKLISNVEHQKKTSAIAPPLITRIDRVTLKIPEIQENSLKLSNGSSTTLELRGGDEKDKKLRKSMVSKSPESEYSEMSFNKTMEFIMANPKMWRIVAEFIKPNKFSKIEAISSHSSKGFETVKGDFEARLIEQQKVNENDLKLWKQNAKLLERINLRNKRLGFMYMPPRKETVINSYCSQSGLPHTKTASARKIEKIDSNISSLRQFGQFEEQPSLFGMRSRSMLKLSENNFSNNIENNIEPSGLSENLTQSTNQVSVDFSWNKPQVNDFLNDDSSVCLERAYDEVKRRAAALGRENFCKDTCPYSRFVVLATECGQNEPNNAREAISILQGEMQGYYKNARRCDYGVNVTGIDFAVEGLGEFENITHVEVKNPVSSAIRRANGLGPSIVKQGKKIGGKILYQQNFWSNETARNTIENIDPTAYFPEYPNKTLGLVDIFDVPPSEKAAMEASVIQGSKNNEQLLFLNNLTNI